MKVLFVCSMGMSSAIAAKALQEEAKKQGIEMEVHECSTQAFESEVEKGYDVAMVAPQIRHRFDTLKPLAEKAEVPIFLIEPQGYTAIGGPRLLKQLKAALNKE